jgi:hypothetical protein
MATITPNYGWDVPTSSDYVKLGAVAIETLGDDIDASLFSITNGKNMGLVPLQTTSISAQTTVTVNSIFSATYDNYKMIFNGTSASTGNLASFQIGGNANNDYKYAEMQLNSQGAGPSNSGFSNATNSGRLGVLSTNNSYFEADFYSPFISGFTSWKSFSNRTDSTLTMYSYFGHVANTASYSSIVISFGSAFTGTMRIYGKRNS